jgi:hypothetical protein
MSKTTTIINAYAAPWVPLYDVWNRFCRDSQQLGISPSHKAMTNFLAVHRGKLFELGVIAKTHTQRLLGHRELFAPAAFAIAIGHDPALAIQQQRLAMAEHTNRGDTGHAQEADAKGPKS